MRQVTVTADDYGLSRSVTDTILEVADKGMLGRVSVLANGLAFDYAMEELRTRTNLELAIHLNLSEGVAISHPQNIPHLVDEEGVFKYSPMKLLLLTLFVLPKTRRDIVNEIGEEMRAQIVRVQTVSTKTHLFIDGHQHVHMIPLVFIQLLKLHKTYHFKSVRIPYEPFFFNKENFRQYLSPAIFRHVGLNILSARNKRRINNKDLDYPEYFVGTLFSGQMTFFVVKSALAEVCRKNGESVEIGFHPGEIVPNEIDNWKGDTVWYSSSWRSKEGKLLMSDDFRILVRSFVEDAFVHPSSRVLEVARFITSGSIAAFTNLTLLYLFTSIVGIWYIFSAVIAYMISISVSFTLQKFWTFSHHSLKKTYSEIFWYIVNNVFSLVINIAGLYVLVEYVSMWYLAAQFILLVLIAIWSFFIYRFLIFRPIKP